MNSAFCSSIYLPFSFTSLLCYRHAKIDSDRAREEAINRRFRNFPFANFLVFFSLSERKKTGCVEQAGGKEEEETVEEISISKRGTTLVTIVVDVNQSWRKCKNFLTFTLNLQHEFLEISSAPLASPCHRPWVLPDIFPFLIIWFFLFAFLQLAIIRYFNFSPIFTLNTNFLLILTLSTH